MPINYNYYPYMYNTGNQSGFISARSIEEAFNWPVAPGNSLTFKIENQPFVCTKTKGFSPLDQPVFERYKLVKVEDAPTTSQDAPQGGYNIKDELTLVWNEINALKAKIGGSGDVQRSNAKPIQAVHAEPRSVYGSDGNTAEHAE